MNRLITLKNGVAELNTQLSGEAISNMELIERLEIAEEVLQLRVLVNTQQINIDQLKAESAAGVGQLDKLQLNDGDLVLLPEDIEQDAVQMLVNHVRDTLGIKNIGFVMGDLSTLNHEEKAQLVAEQVETKVALTRGKLAETLQENQHLHDYNAELKAAADALGARGDTLEEECRRITINSHTLGRKLETEQNAHKATQGQLKKLKALDPERLQKQVIKLKKSSAEKQTAIEALRIQNNAVVKDNKTKAATIAKMDLALETKCEDINEQNTPNPLEVVNCGNLGRWNIYGTQQVNCYDIMDVKNNVSMRLQINDGALIVPEIRALPKSLQQRILVRAARYASIEKSIAEDQKPLETGAK